MATKKNIPPIKKAIPKTPRTSTKKTDSSSTFDFLNTFVNNRYFSIIAICTFFIIALVYCKPIFEGKRLITSDGVAATAMFSDLDKFKDVAEKETITWTNAQFGGMPAGYKISNFNPFWINDFVYYESSILHFNSLSFSLIFFLMFGMFLLLNSLNLNKIISAIISIAFALTTFNMISIQVGHATKILCLSFLLSVMAGIIEVANKKYLKGMLIYSFFLTCNLYANHIQIVYYSIIVILILIITQTIFALQNKDFKHIAKSFLALLLPTLLLIVVNINYLNTYYFGKETMRGGKKTVQTEHEIKNIPSKNENKGLDKDYAFSWSYGINESMTYMIPNFMGGGNQNYLVQDQSSNTYNALVSQGGQEANQLAQATTAYWGEQPFVIGTYYYGIIIIALCLFFFIDKKNKHKYWLLPILLFFFFLSIGKNFQTFNYFLFDHLPMYNKFRAPSMAQSMVQIVLFVAAALGLYRIAQVDDNELNDSKKKFIIAFGFIAFLAILCIILPTIFGNFSSSNESKLPPWLVEAMRKDRISILKKDAIRGLLYLIIAAGICYAILIKKLNKEIGFLLVGLVCIIDLWNVDKRFFKDDDFKEPFENISEVIPMTPVDAEILKDTDPHYRVFNLFGGDPFNDHSTSVYHQSIGGYSPAKLGKYQELIENHLSKMNYSVISMLNTKYIIYKDQQTGAEKFQINTQACGHAWFVDSLITTNDDYEELHKLDNFNPKTTAFINKKLVNNLPLVYTKNADDYINLTSYLPHKMKYEYTAKTPQFIVFPEIYYMQEDKEGWYAKLDGKPVDIKQVDFLLRGIAAPAGKHTIEMEMIRDKFALRAKISMVAFLLLNIFWIIGLFLLYKKRKQVKATL